MDMLKRFEKTSKVGLWRCFRRTKFCEKACLGEKSIKSFERNKQVRLQSPARFTLLRSLYNERTIHCMFKLSVYILSFLIYKLFSFLLIHCLYFV